MVMPVKSFLVNSPELALIERETCYNEASQCVARTQNRGTVRQRMVPEKEKLKRFSDKKGNENLVAAQIRKFNEKVFTFSQLGGN